MIPYEKQILRTRARAALEAFDGKAAASARIHELLRATPIWREAQTIYGFSPLASEPDWLGERENDGKVLAFPKVTDREMAFFSGGRMVAGVFRISEPADGEPAPPPDLVLVPALAYDRTGQRLGRGGGYYDRWLETHPGVRTLGVCFACQLVDRMPVEEHDVRVDAVLTEEGLIST